MKKLFVTLFLCLFLISFASTLEFDNVKTIEKEVVDYTIGDKIVAYNPLWEVYSPIKIDNIFGLGENLFTGAITEHTEVCGSDCESIIEIYHNSGTLIQDIRFVGDEPLSYKIYIQDGQKQTLVNDYETQCEVTRITENGTKITDCNNVNTGSHYVTEPVWKEYIVGEDMDEGNYVVKIGGSLNIGDKTDWQIKVQGIWLDSWAIWDSYVVAYFKMNNDTLREEVSGSDATSDTSTNVSGKLLSARDYELDTTQYTNYGDKFDVTGDYATWNAWVKPETLLTSQWVVSKDVIGQRDFSFGLSRDKVNIGIDTDGADSDNSTTTIIAGNWYMITATWDDTTNNVSFYINGSYVSSDTMTTSLSDVTADFRIGSREYVGSEGYFDGSIDEVGIWNRTLTAEEISLLYNNGVGLSYSSEPLSITLGYPSNAKTFVLNPITFNATGSSFVGNEITNMTYWNDVGGWSAKNTTIVTGITNTSTWLYSIPFGTTTWNVKVCSDNSCTFSSNRTVIRNNITEDSQTYPSTAVESSTQTFTANVRYDSSRFSIITAKLLFNGTEYIGTRTGSGSSAIYSANAIMPPVSLPTNISSQWTISLTDVGGTTDYNLTSYNTSVEIINFSLCDATTSVPFWNYTVLNESNGAEINSTFEGTFSIRSIGSTATSEFSYSDTTGNNSQYDFCISPSTESYIIYTAIKLTKSGYVDKFYNYQEVTITNTTREDNLYLLTTGDSTSFIIKVVDTSATNIEEAEVQVQRYYPGTNTWATTEILTTNYVGEAVGHILSEDADYRFKVYQDGISTYNSSATKITCATAPCTVTLVIPINVNTGIEDVEDFTSSLTFSSTTNVFTYSYSDTSNNLDNARLFVYRVFPSNATIVAPCNETKTAVSGVITCDITGSLNGTYRAIGYVTRDDIEYQVQTRDAVLGTAIYNSMGVDGVLWAFFIFMAIIMLGLARPSLAIIFGVVGVFALSALQIINIGAISIVAIVAIGIILLTRIGRE